MLGCIDLKQVNDFLLFNNNKNDDRKSNNIIHSFYMLHK